MLLTEAVSLIQAPGIFHTQPAVWADLGCGSGLFTEALAQILAPGSSIFAIDKNLNDFKLNARINQIEIKSLELDFIKQDLNLKNLDGMLMANTFHFVKDKKVLLEKLKPHFRNNPVFLIVEYDTNVPNPWVPFPIRYTDLKVLFSDLGYSSVLKINERPSRFRSGNMYSVFLTA